jgi:hypothetical protein
MDFAVSVVKTTETALKPLLANDYRISVSVASLVSYKIPFLNSLIANAIFYILNN